MSTGRRRLALATLGSIVAALAAGSVVRVPEGSVRLAGETLLASGWHLRAPYRSVPRISSPGEIVLADLELRTREGSDLTFRLELAYRIGTKLSPQFARDVRGGGLTGAVRGLAEHVLRDAGSRTDAETLLSSASLVEAPLTAALESSGIGVARLSFRSPLGDDVIRRRANESARAVARAPLGPIVLIGWDGADWDVIRPLVAAGRMPHLARFLARGAHGDLRSYDPMFSPLIWTTVATGKAPTEHGIADFVVKDVANNARRPITSDFRKVKALWNVFTDFQRRSAWIAWWASYPAEPIDGVIVSDVVGASLISSGPEKAASLAAGATPDGFLAERRHLLVPVASVTQADVAGFFEVSDADWSAAIEELSQPKRADRRKKGEEGTQSPAAFVCRVLATTRTYHALARDLVRSGTPFVAVYYEGVDMMGHRFQHFMPPKMEMVSTADFARFQHAVARFYEYQDQLLGDLLSVAHPEAFVVIVSDHGFLSGSKRPEGLLPFTSVQPAEWHRDWGILAMAGPGVKGGELPPASVYDIAPTLLYLEGLPLAEDMPGRLVSAALTPELLRRAPPRSIRSYELAGTRLEHAAGAPVDAAAMEEMMANLRALGYVGGEPAAGPPGAAPVASAGGGERLDTQVYYHRNLAVSYIKQGRYREAEGELLTANERQPLGKTYSMLSEVRATQRRFDDAASALEEGWAKIPEAMEPSSLLWIVELHLLSGDGAGAERAVARWSTKMSPAVRAAADGRLADTAGDTARATTLYGEALRQDPLLVRIAQRTSELDTAAGRPGALEPFLESTLRAHPQVDAYWDLAGQFAMARGDAGTAAERFGKARALQPENGLYLGHFAAASAASGRTADARDALAWAERFPSRDADAWLAIGSAWDRLGETERAVAAFDRSRAAGLSGPGADLGSALALARAGRGAEARGVLEEASRRFPGNRAIRELRSRLEEASR